jgi:hypothetical protein
MTAHVNVYVPQKTRNDRYGHQMSLLPARNIQKAHNAFYYPMFIINSLVTNSNEKNIWIPQNMAGGVQ